MASIVVMFCQNGDMSQVDPAISRLVDDATSQVLLLSVKYLSHSLNIMLILN